MIFFLLKDQISAIYFYVTEISITTRIQNLLKRASLLIMMKLLLVTLFGMGLKQFYALILFL